MPAPQSVILVRHAQSEHHVRGLTGGWTDTPLTPLGHDQAARVAQRLADELAGVRVSVLTSDLLRASETAGQIAAALGVEVRREPRLREHNNGEAANLTLEEFARHYPDTAYRPWAIDEIPFPGAESNRQLYARCTGLLDCLEADGTVPILVTHGGIVPRLIGAWLGLTVEAMEQLYFACHPASISVLNHVNGDTRNIERFNDTGHLRGIEGWASLSRLAVE